jgi:hypothetical protein
MCVLSNRGKFKNYSFICAHAPTEEMSEREKAQFCDRLDRTYKQCPSHDTKIILGDMNAKVGKEIWMGTAAMVYMMKVMRMEHISLIMQYINAWL